jgi:hypothetical protein
MVNAHVVQRLSSLRALLLAQRAGGSTLSNSTRGTEREIFVKEALANVIAPPFRITSGDITDTNGSRSGQLDTVIEFSNSVSFRMTSTGPRLYLAEGVCAVVEVKSDLSNQWDEVEATFANVNKLDCNRAASMTYKDGGFTIVMGDETSKIPVFAVGFSGWKQADTLSKKVADLGINGALLIEEEIYASALKQEVTTGPRALFEFFVEISNLAVGMLGSTPNYTAYVS